MTDPRFTSTVSTMTTTISGTRVVTSTLPGGVGMYFSDGEGESVCNPLTGRSELTLDSHYHPR